MVYFVDIYCQKVGTRAWKLTFEESNRYLCRTLLYDDTILATHHRMGQFADLYNQKSIIVIKNKFGSNTTPFVEEQIWTRKYSCVHAKGIPPAVYQVLHLLSYPGGGGTPSLACGGRYPISGWDGDGVPPGCELTNKLKLLPSPSFGYGR